MRVVEEREDKFEVDPDWVMPQVKRLAPDGGRVEREVRKLENTYFDTPECGPAAVWGHTSPSDRGFGDGLAVEGPTRHFAYRTAECLAGQEVAPRLGTRRGGFARR